MGKTSIEWCDHSINPLRARLKDGTSVGHYCEKISQGCANCYSSKFQPRFGMPAFGSGQRLQDVELFLDEAKLDEVRRRKKPTRYFWCDMTDMFGDWVKPEWIGEILRTIDATPQHTHQLLTKRPENIQRMWSGGFRNNCWLGTSVENQECADKRIPELLKCRHLSPVLFLSCEPLLGEVDLCYPRSLYPNGPQNCCSGFECGCQGMPIDPPEYLWSPDGDSIDWVIVGGESGPSSRPLNPHHARSLINQCKTFGVPVFFKQVGEWASFTMDYPGLHIVAHQEDGSDVLIGADVDGKRYGKDHVYLNDLDEIAYVKVGKKAAGRLFEGVEYSQFPKVGE